MALNADQEGLLRRLKTKRAGIEEHMHHKDDTKKKFVCRYDLEGIWDNKSLRKFFPSWNPKQAERFREQLVITFSILVFIQYPIEEDPSAFRELFENALINSWTDERLPLRRDRPDHYLYTWLRDRSEEHADDFIQKQHFFLPCVLQRSELGSILTADPRQPLPFQDEPQLKAIGGFGEVYKVTIARDCYVEGTMANRKPEVLAYKKFTNEDVYEREVSSFKILRDSLVHYGCIASHVAAIKHGVDLFIFHKYTELGDLQILLDGGREQVKIDGPWRPKYIFEEKFQNPARSLFIGQLQDIAKGLHYLHDVLPKVNKDGVFCAHMDLKPDNILIYPADNPDQPNVGKWVLTDFGIASFRDADEPTAHDSFRTMGQVIKSMDKQGTERQASGTHRAPEMHERSRIRVKDGKLCDIWSFGCIMNEVFAFILPGFEGGNNPSTRATGSLEDFQMQKQMDSSNDYWFDFEDDGDGGDEKPIIKECVQNWLQDRPRPIISERARPGWPEPEWADSMVRLIFRTIKPKPEDRPKADNVLSSLKEIKDQIERYEHPGQAVWSRVNREGRGNTNDRLDRTESGIARRPTGMVSLEKANVERSRWEVLLPSARSARVRGFAVSPDTQTASWLVQSGSAYHLHVFDIVSHSASEKQQTPKFEPITLLEDVKWKDLTMSNLHILVTGQKETSLRGQIFDRRNGKEVQLPGGWPEDCIRMACSSKGYFAWETLDRSKVVKIWNGQNDPLSERVFTRGNGINNIGFSGDGSYLCAWTSGGGKNFVYMTRMIPIGQPIEQNVPMKRVSHRHHSFWMTQDTPACVIQEAKHHDRYFFTFDNSVRKMHQMVRTIPKDDGRWVFALGNDVLAMARKSWIPKLGKTRLRVVRKHFDTDSSRGLGSSEHERLDEKEIHGSVIKMAVHQADKKETIVICTNRGEVIQYKIDFHRGRDAAGTDAEQTDDGSTTEA